MQAPDPSNAINFEIARQLREMAELPDKNKYQKRAYRNAAKVIQAHLQPITSGELAKALPGVGTSVASKIDEILTTGQITTLATQPESEKTKRQVKMLFKSIHGVGDVKAEEWYNIGYRNLNDLLVIYNTSAFTNAQRLGYYYHSDLQKRIPRSEIDVMSQLLTQILAPLQVTFVIAGSYRRLLPSSGDIDMLIESVNKDGTQITMHQLTDALMKSGILVGNLTPDADIKFMGIIKIQSSDQVFLARRLDIRLIDSKSWPYALLYFTGSKEFNIKMRNRALSFGLSLSEYGLTDSSGNKFPSSESGIHIKTERDIFNLLQMKYLDPHERTDVVEIELVQGAKQETGKWFKPYDSLLIYISDIILAPTPNPVKTIAGFDLDHTLIDNASESKFTHNINDVRVMQNRIEILQSLHSKGFTIVIFTNQKSKTEAKRNFILQKLQRSVALLGVPMIIIASLAADQFRKPAVGMWTEAEKILTNVNWASSFFSGDAAGRQGDFSDSDMMFAKNKGVTFYTPEQIFS